jgi:hypothetical protein
MDTRRGEPNSRFGKITWLALVIGWAVSPLIAGAQSKDAQGLGAWCAEASKTSDYNKASAVNPMYQNKALWPKLSGKEYFLQETWPKGKLMTWAKPGQNGGKRAKGLNPLDPANWLEDGKPCTKVEFDENTDLFLPASDKPYEINFREDPWPEIYRHITVEQGCSFSGGGDGRGRKVTGNVWVKVGGDIYAQGATDFRGNRHTFFRNDSGTLANTRKNVNYQMCSQYFTFGKDKDKSVEFLGHVTVLDEFKGNSGIIIVGPDSWLQPGRNAGPFLAGGTVLALMDGSRFGNWQNNFGNIDLEVRGSHVWGGLPDRPLTRSCRFDAHFKNYTQATPPGLADKKDAERNLPRTAALVFTAGSSIRSYTTDPAKARLKIQWFGALDSVYGQDPTSPSGQERAKKDAGYADKMKWFTALPRGIDLWIDKNAVVENVELDDVRKGGVMLQSAGLKSNFKNVTFGSGCLGKGDEVYSVIEKLGKNGRY